MEHWSAREDRPYHLDSLRDPLREPPRSNIYSWLVAALSILLAASAGYYFLSGLQGPLEPSAPAQLGEAPAAPAQPAASGIAHPVGTAPDATLPTLENSDSMMREALAGLLGRRAFDDLVIPEQLVRRIVATVDNLPRQTAPRRVVPLNPVPGALAVKTVGSEATIDAANAARYSPYVRVFEALDSRSAAQTYLRAYPIFQRAYEELGFPGLYFNDRLVQALDDLLAAPEPEAAPALLRPKVLYEFADPDLETRSAGQKILLRMGADNARRVKAKLRELRSEIARR